MSLLSIGTDSEIFARNKNNKAISLCGLIGGSKDQPIPLGSLGDGFFVQEDNVSVEFNIPPARDANYWDKYIEVALTEVSKLLDVNGLCFSHDASISFDVDQLIHPNALIFGCEPDYNAWTKMENAKPLCNDPTLRTAGGHVHVGTRINMIHGVEKMDLYLGVPSVILDNSPASKNRRNLYGKAGAMRPKPYGFEYRVLSNFWIFTSTMRRWVYNNTELAMNMTGHKVSTSDASDIQQCINEGDERLAEKLIKKFDIPMPSDVRSKVRTARLTPSHWVIDDIVAMNTILASSQ